MNVIPLPSLDFLRECFALSKHSPSGIIWKVRPASHFPTERGARIFNSQRASKPAGSIYTDYRYPDSKYWVVRIGKQLFFVHRIVYSLISGKIIAVDEEVDHADVNGLNNSRNNLRLATRSNNCKNRKRRLDNTSGFKNVSWHKAAKCWIVQITSKGVTHRDFAPTAEKANALAHNLRQKLHQEFSRTK